VNINYRQIKSTHLNSTQFSTKHLNNVYEYITSPLFPEPWAVSLMR